MDEIGARIGVAFAFSGTILELGGSSKLFMKNGKARTVFFVGRISTEILIIGMGTASIGHTSQMMDQRGSWT